MEISNFDNRIPFPLRVSCKDFFVPADGFQGGESKKGDQEGALLYDREANPVYDYPLSSRDLGALAEEQACKYLRERDYSLLARNWYCRWGELDIVARKGKTIIAVEVKGSYKGWDPLENMTPRKLAKVARLLQIWLQKNSLDEFCVDSRIDAVAVTFVPRFRVQHFMGVW